MVRLIDFWKVQNTGWSGGISWFDTGGSAANPLRFDNQGAAESYANGAQWGDPSVRWRLVHTSIETTDTKRVTTEEFIPLSI